ncbi:unnamed protein product [Macrosiphum euphorbiae]|uniref:Secreted protein n=1 Tax=Macrosiphum euphorbiae TaxID=13131 RepID=A0AAV0W4Z4_9HEMI|nr:unnamed protein product [Macrosiphum euphorbiae]
MLLCTRLLICSPHTVTLVVDQLLASASQSMNGNHLSQCRVRAVSISVLTDRRQVLDRVLDCCLPRVLLHLRRFQGSALLPASPAMLYSRPVRNPLALACIGIKHYVPMH